LAARFIETINVRFQFRDAGTTLTGGQAYKSQGGTRAALGPKPAAEERGPSPVPTAAKNVDDRSVRVARDAEANAPRPPAASNAGANRLARDLKSDEAIRAKVSVKAPAPSQMRTQADPSVRVARDGEASAPPPHAASNAGANRVARDLKSDEAIRSRISGTAPAPSHVRTPEDRPVRVARDSEVSAPRSPAAPYSDAGTSRVAPGFESVAEQGRAEIRGYPRTPSGTKPLFDRSIMVPSDGRMTVEDERREQLFQTQAAFGGFPGEPSNRLRNRDIIAAAAAAIAIGFTVTAFLPSILTRASGDPVPVPVATPGPAQQPQPKQAGATETPPAQATGPADPSSVESWSLVNTGPVLNQLGSNRSASQAQSQVAKTEATAPNVAKVAPEIRTDVAGAEKSAKQEIPARMALSAEEKSAIERGLKELGGSVATPALPPAPNRFQLSAEEQAAVERGLRELEKAPGAP
jgi:hypothetical protein